MNAINSTEIKYRLIKILESNPKLTQRQMAEEMGVSLGKFNYCLKELVKSGLVKVERFKTSSNKVAYLYLLTPKGINEKARITTRFLERKLDEYERIKQEISVLREEINAG